MPAVWLCLLWETPESEGAERQAARVRLLSLSGDGCLSLWGRAPLSECAGADGPVGPGGVAGSVYLADSPRAARRGLSTPVAARIPCPNDGPWPPPKADPQT